MATPAETGPLVTVRLLGRGGELVREQTGTRTDMELPVRIARRENLTPLTLIQEIAEQNPLLHDHIVRADGAPRSSTRILFDGVPPKDLAMPLEILGPPPFKEPDEPAPEMDVSVDIHGDFHIAVGGIHVDVEIAIVVPCDG